MNAFEPEWTKSISSNTVCTYFYVLFLIVAVAAGIVVLMDLSVVFSSGGKKGLALLFRSLLMLVLPLLNALFLYILCARSLLEKK
jgi:hypothetical protein